MSWKIFFGTFVILVVIGVFITLRVERSSPTQNHSVKIVASFYPVAEFAQQVAGADAEVISITPAGVEPHDFEPTPQDVAKVYDADLFIYNGSGLDAWAQDLAPDVEQQGGMVLDMSRYMGVLLTADQHQDDDEHGDEESSRVDPHFWLSPVLAQTQVKVIRDALSKRDPVHAQDYERRADAYLAQLASVDAEYRSGLAACASKTVVTSHAAFGYLAQAYGFEQLSIMGLSPDQEPSAGAMADLAAQAKDRQISYVFFETLVSPELAQTLAREIGAQTLVFNPLEGLTVDELAAGKNYLSVMRDNLQQLRTAMLCQ